MTWFEPKNQGYDYRKGRYRRRNLKANGERYQRIGLAIVSAAFIALSLFIILDRYFTISVQFNLK